MQSHLNKYPEGGVGVGEDDDTDEGRPRKEVLVWVEGWNRSR